VYPESAHVIRDRVNRELRCVWRSRAGGPKHDRRRRLEMIDKVLAIDTSWPTAAFMRAELTEELADQFGARGRSFA
jgi:hypothetical protein